VTLLTQAPKDPIFAVEQIERCVEFLQFPESVTAHLTGINTTHYCLPLIQDENLVIMDDRPQAVSNAEDRPRRELRQNCLLDFGIGFQVHACQDKSKTFS
jgi:hypothetical protein